MKRKVIRIDEAKCNGCGLCIPDCPEGAIQLIDGKARLISDLFCDGLGACIGTCPEKAITIEEREAEPYDEAKVMENIIKAGPSTIKAHLEHLRDHGQKEYLDKAMDILKARGIEIPMDLGTLEPRDTSACGCPGAKAMDFRDEGEEPGTETTVSRRSALRQWPVQLQLLSPYAPYFKDAHLVITADCVPFAQPDFHERFLKGKILIILCPKLDKVGDEYLEKLAEILKSNDIKSITIVHMEVPCCFGLTRLVREAVKASGKDITVKDYTISIRGDVVEGRVA
jgi:Pyruvate/2-oxoacid:ferredoxin oxidoreductase delta subunit